jgi:beta-phosphoglucomutase
MGVIFDLDGVLVDSAWAHKQAWYDLARKENLRMTDEFFHDTFGMQNYQIIPMLVGQNVSAEEVDRMGDWKEQRYRQLIADKLFLADGVEPLLNGLRGKGFLVAIGSSAPRANLDLLLDCLHARRYFDVCVTKEDVRESKPSPQTFLKAAEKLGLPPNRCVVVEDAIPGVEAGKSAGMSVVAVTTSRKREDLAKADIIVDSLAELNAEDFLKLLA